MHTTSKAIGFHWVCLVVIVALACGSDDHGLWDPVPTNGSGGSSGVAGTAGVAGAGLIECNSDNQCTEHGMLCNKALGLCELPGGGGAAGAAGTGGAGAGASGASGTGGGAAGTGGGTAGSGGAGTGGSTGGGWPGPGAGEVVCGPSLQTCDRSVEYCCNGPLSHCVPNGGECLLGIVQQCDGPSDCPGSVCCLYGVGYMMEIYCDPNCAGAWVCDEDPDACPSGTQCISGAISYCG